MEYILIILLAAGIVASFILGILGITKIIKWSRPSYRGSIGENKVSSILTSLPDGYFVFEDVYLNVDGRSVQIDHVVISAYGIFVIETKNYKGWIYGSDESEYWTKNIYGRKYQFRNPIKQNFSHVAALSRLLGPSYSSFIPVVVFLNGATLKCDARATVLYCGQLIDFIMGYKDSIFDFEEIIYLNQKLESAIVQDKDRECTHIKSVSREMIKRRILINNGICPRCKGPLVERKGIFGDFIGCGNYPRCRFTARVC